MEDYSISKAEVKKRLYDLRKSEPPYAKEVLGKALMLIEGIAPIETAEVVYGRWERKVEWYDNGFTYIDMVYHTCSECGFKTNWRDKFDDRHKTLYNYCPRCGAKMEDESNLNDSKKG